MKFLYIDRARNIEDVRVGEQKIFGTYFPQFDNEIHFLLLGRGDKSVAKNLYVWRRFNTFFYRRFLNLDYIAILIKGILVYKYVKYEVIIARKNLTTALAGIALSKVFNIPFIYVASFPKWESIIEKGKNKKLKWIYNFVAKIYFRLFLYVCKNSKLILPQTKWLWDNLKKNKGLEKIPYFPIPLGFDNTWILPSKSKIELRKELGIDFTKKVIIYFGAMEKERELKFFIEIIDSIIKEKPEILVLFIGGTNSQLQVYKEYVKSLNISDYFFFSPHVKRELLHKFISTSDIAVSPIPPVPVFLYSSPTKVIESLGYGIPVVANEEIFDHKEVIESSGGGILTPYRRDTFSAAIKHLLENDVEREKMSSNAHNYILKNRSYECMAKDLNEIIKKILVNKTPQKVLTGKTL